MLAAVLCAAVLGLPTPCSADGPERERHEMIERRHQQSFERARRDSDQAERAVRAARDHLLRQERAREEEAILERSSMGQAGPQGDRVDPAREIMREDAARRERADYDHARRESEAAERWASEARQRAERARDEVERAAKAWSGGRR
ncbi:MAG: hypothetical protein ACT4P2_08080 [Pseudomonadota bacterium]